MSMNENLKKLFERIKTYSLSERERYVMREYLRFFMAEHPARAPLSVRAADEIRAAFFSFQITSFARWHPAALALVLVLTVGVGTSYAAEGALPGDALYPVKINLNEPVLGALATSNQAKADWNAARAVRRLEEAESLAAEGRLTADVQSDLETQFDRTSKDFDENVLALANASGSPAAVAASLSNLAGSLEKHEGKLAQVADATPQSKNALASIQERVRARRERADRVRAVADRFVLESHGGNDARVQTIHSGGDEKKRGAATIAPAPTPLESSGAARTPQSAANIQVSAGVQVSVQAPVDFETAIREAQDEDSHGSGKQGGGESDSSHGGDGGKD